MNDMDSVSENLQDFSVDEKASTSNTYTEETDTVCYLLNFPQMNISGFRT